MMKKFHLIRTQDLSGVSGIGKVAEGVQFSDGTCVISWLTKHHSIGIYDSIEEIIAVHGHQGRTYVAWMGELFGRVETKKEIMKWKV